MLNAVKASNINKLWESYSVDMALLRIIESPLSGKGVVATASIVTETKVIEIKESAVTSSDININDYDLQFLQIDDDNLYLMGTGTADDYINHSCNPNLETDEETSWLYARLDIVAGICRPYLRKRCGKILSACTVKNH